MGWVENIVPDFEGQNLLWSSRGPPGCFGGAGSLWEGFLQVFVGERSPVSLLPMGPRVTAGRGGSPRAFEWRSQPTASGAAYLAGRCAAILSVECQLGLSAGRW